MLGGWVPSVPEPEAKLLLRSHSFQHAWHAELWESLGAAVGRGPDLASVSPLVDGLSGVEAVTADRLRAVYEGVVPALVTAYRALLVEVSPLTDGALVRSVGLMVADDEAAMEAARGLLDIGNAGGSRRR